MTRLDVCICGNNWGGLLEELQSRLPELRVGVLPRHELKHHPEIRVLIPGIAKITDELLSSLPNLQLIHQAGVGLDAVDVDSATRRGIWVANVPSYGTGNAESVAEIALLHMLLLSRRIYEAQREMAEGNWGNPLGSALIGKTVGIYGVGGLGLALAERLHPFGVRLIGIKRTPDPALAKQYRFDWIKGTDYRELLLKESDFVVITATANETVEHPFQKADFQQMKNSAYLINVARGVWVNEKDLLEALERKEIAGAGLDVLYEEPPASPQKWLKSPLNLVVTPHIGGRTAQSFTGISEVVAQNIRRVWEHLPPITAANQPKMVS